MSDSNARIVVTGRIPDSGLAILRSSGDVWAWDSDDPIPTDIRNAHLADAQVAVTLLTDRVDGAFLDAAPNLVLIANVAVGYNNIDVAACTARGITVTNTPGVLTDATADLAMGLLLMISRRLGEGERLIRSGASWKWGMFMMLGTGLQGRRLGIIGMGGIGEAMATRANAFGMEIVYHNRKAVDPEIEKRLGASLVSLDELLATSDVVSLNCPYSEATHHLIDAAALGSMRHTSFLINTARGPIVDEAALVDALVAGEIAGAGLDVFENEPDVHPGLFNLDNVVLVPHLGSATHETRGAMANLAANNVAAVLGGNNALTAVN
jgi:glyoxylate reductase